MSVSCYDFKVGFILTIPISPNTTKIYFHMINTKQRLINLLLDIVSRFYINGMLWLEFLLIRFNIVPFVTSEVLFTVHFCLLYLLKDSGK